MPAQAPNDRRPRAVAIFLALTALLLAGATARLGKAETAPKPAKAAAAADVSTSTDDLQRSLRLDTYKILADSGAARGENIYFYKCWMCHNQYTKSAPLLKDLFQRESLSSGDPVNDDNVTAKIKEGGPGMPAFRTSLSDVDIADLRAYFHSG
jgi:mono/diheme cytochrome c family protein